jgi:hypothetical protein
MKTSLTVLIILTVVVLIVILMTSPTCRNAVSSVLGGKKQVQKAVKSTPPVASQPAKPSVNSIQRPSGSDMRAAAAAMGQRPGQAPQVQSSTQPLGPQQVNFVPPSEAPKMEVMSDPKYPVLNGNLLDMFNNTVDVQATFGLSESQIDAMAKEYKETFLDVKKDEVARHRSIIRSHLEEAETKLRQGLTKLSGPKPSIEESLVSMHEERVPAQKPSIKLSITSRK